MALLAAKHQLILLCSSVYNDHTHQISKLVDAKVVRFVSLLIQLIVLSDVLDIGLKYLTTCFFFPFTAVGFIWKYCWT